MRQMHFTDERNSSIFRISSVSYEDAGIYECVADNGIPPSIRANFTMTIRGRNKIPFFEFL